MIFLAAKRLELQIWSQFHEILCMLSNNAFSMLTPSLDTSMAAHMKRASSYQVMASSSQLVAIHTSSRQAHLTQV
ncbi:hypothetical protein KSS87_009673 [Heliosperma pusillum]|nr:hypothetical protein KSS87_009673 [Heliosperma pusillum]